VVTHPFADPDCDIEVKAASATPAAAISDSARMAWDRAPPPT